MESEIREILVVESRNLEFIAWNPQPEIVLDSLMWGETADKPPNSGHCGSLFGRIKSKVSELMTDFLANITDILHENFRILIQFF